MTDSLPIVDFATAPQVEEASRPAAERVLEGNPEQLIRNVFTDATGQFHAGVWSSTPGKWRVRYTENEFCHLLEGVICLTDMTGSTTTFTPGASFIVPAGFTGIWEVVESARKLYVIFDPKS